VDGSNLVGSLRHLNAQVSEYQDFYKHVFEEALTIWKTSISGQTHPVAQLTRVHWYQMGTMDELNLSSDTRLLESLKNQFLSDVDLKRSYLALAGNKLKGRSQTEITTEAWNMCINECKSWYENKCRQLNEIRKFNYGVRSSTDFIDIIECGHWKIDLLYKSATEKGVDTRMAVDMVTNCRHFDVALVISGDADAIPSVNFIKNNGCQIATVDIIKGYPPEKRGRQSSTKLQNVSDFVVPIFEMSLMQKKIITPYIPKSNSI